MKELKEKYLDRLVSDTSQKNFNTSLIHSQIKLKNHLDLKTNEKLIYLNWVEELKNKLHCFSIQEAERILTTLQENKMK